MDDLISRQAAIDAVRHSPIIEVQPAYMLIDKADVLKNLVMIPSAQPNLQPTCNQLATDCISRQAAIKAIEDLQDCYNGFSDTYDKACIIGVLEEVPSTQPERRGKWYHGEAYPHHLYCSVCYRTALPNDEYVERWGLHMNFCPNCGADMRGEQDE